MSTIYSAADPDVTIVVPDGSPVEPTLTYSVIGGDSIDPFADGDVSIVLPSDEPVDYLPAESVGDVVSTISDPGFVLSPVLTGTTEDMSPLFDIGEQMYVDDMNLASLTQEPEPTYTLDQSYDAQF